MTRAARIVRHVITNYVEHGCTIYAAAISYYTLLTCVPLFLAAISGLGYLLGSSDSALDEVLRSVARVAPGARDAIESALTTVIRQRRGVGLIALLTIVWTGSAVFTVLERAMDASWGVQQRRALWQSKLRGAALVILAGLGLLLSTLLASIISLHARSLDVIGLEALTHVPGVWRYIVLGVQYILSICAFTVLMRLVPNTAVPVRSALFGGLLSATLWEISKHLFATYATQLAPYQGTYGPIGGVIVLLVWIYYSAAIILFGAEAAALHARAREGAAPVAPLTGAIDVPSPTRTRVAGG